MPNDDNDREFRIRPPKPRKGRGDEGRIWSSAFSQMMHFARMSSHRRKGRPGGMALGASRRLRAFSQRCAIRVTYSANRTAGQWAAHGRYLTREGATQSESGKPLGFDDRGEVGDLDSRLAEWQKADDPRLFKLIISPEFGDRLNLQALTRSLMAKMEVDLGTRLQWVGTVHRNTEYPHVHVALRGITEDRQPLR